MKVACETSAFHHRFKSILFSLMFLCCFKAVQLIQIQFKFRPPPIMKLQ